MFGIPKFDVSRSNAAVIRAERDVLASQFKSAVRLGNSLRENHKELLQQAEQDYLSRVYGIFYKNGAQAVLAELRKLVSEGADLSLVFAVDRDGDVFLSNPNFRRIFAVGVRASAHRIGNDQTHIQKLWHAKWGKAMPQLADDFLMAKMRGE